MKTTTFFAKTLVASLAIMMTFSCQKDQNITDSNPELSTESRLRFEMPACTSVLGTEWDKEIILNGPEYLLKAMYNAGIKMPDVHLSNKNTKWELISVCGDAYVSFSPKGELYIESVGFDTYSLEDVKTKIVSGPFDNFMTLVSGKRDEVWKIVMLDVTSYRNRIIIAVQKSSENNTRFSTMTSSNVDFALVTINLHTNLREINEYNIGQGSLSVIGFSFGG